MAQDEPKNPETPKSGTPSWAVGLAFLITTGVSAATGTYFVVSSDIKQYISSTREIKLEEIKAGIKNNAEENIRLRETNVKLSERLDDLLSRISSTSFEKAECKIKQDICQRELEAANKRATSSETTIKN